MALFCPLLNSPFHINSSNFSFTYHNLLWHDLEFLFLWSVTNGDASGITASISMSPPSLIHTSVSNLCCLSASGPWCCEHLYLWSGVSLLLSNYIIKMLDDTSYISFPCCIYCHPHPAISSIAELFNWKKKHLTKYPFMSLLYTTNVSILLKVWITLM